MSAPLACVACGAPGARPWHSLGGHVIHRCSACGTGQLERGTLTLDPKALYGRGYYVGDGTRSYLDYAAEETNLSRTHRKLLRWLEGHLPSPGRLLEVGCAMGFFLAAARARGWETTGFEVSDFACSIAARRPELGVNCADFTAAEVRVEPASFDVAVALDTIEHLTRPELLLSKMAAALRSGGLCLISTGDFSSLHARLAGRHWRLLAPPEHVFYFTRTGLFSLLRKHGFQPLAVRYPGRWYSLGTLAAFAGLRLPAALGRLPLPVNTFDVMHVLARLNQRPAPRGEPPALARG